MAPADREYLEEQCSGCHELNRVFWTRGSHSIWEMVLDQEQHREIELEPAERKRLLQIFQQYLSKP
jgi:cytochrome c1